MKEKNAKIKEGQVIHGWEVQRITPKFLGGIASLIFESEHLATGAKSLHIDRDDDEMVVGVLFKTIPTDSTGVNHILEHSVLMGSHKFPTSDPFVYLMKNTLHSFLNAMTWPDRTVYPAASYHLPSYRMLRALYLDAVFNPLLEKHAFLQEGWRYVFNESGNLDRKGVVLGEMLSNYSNPVRLMENYILGALFSATPYRHDSGGNPREIPNLTYEQFLTCYKNYYHKSNSRIFSYNDSLEELFGCLEKEYFKSETRLDLKTDIPHEPRWTEPKIVEGRYPIPPNVDPSDKNQYAVAWDTEAAENAFAMLSLEALFRILHGDTAAPLRKAINESGLGKGMCDLAHFDDDYRDAAFITGFKGIKQESIPTADKIIFNTLENLAHNGVPENLVSSVIQQIEFSLKKVDGYHWGPYGHRLFQTVASGWIRGGDPVDLLSTEDHLNRLKEEVKQGGFFEGLIRKYLLDNKNRVHFTLVPDLRMNEEYEKEVQAELKQIQSDLTDAEKDTIKAEAQDLEERQNKEEDTSSFPVLDRSELPKDIKVIPETSSDSSWITLYEQPTNDIVFIDAALNTAALPKKLIPYVPLFCYALPKMDDNFVRQTTEHTGGIGLKAHAYPKYGTAGNYLSVINLKTECQGYKLPDTVDLLGRLMQRVDFSDLKQLGDIAKEFKSKNFDDSNIIREGHNFAVMRAAQGLHKAFWYNEQWNGLSQMLTLNKIMDNMTEEKMEVLAKNLTRIGNIVFRHNNIKMAVTAEDKGLSVAEGLVRGLKNNLPKVSPRARSFIVKPELLREGWCTAEQTSHAACAFSPVLMDHPQAPAVAVMAKILDKGYLWKKIREEGGAYGTGAPYNYLSGNLVFYSYRDKQVVTTQKVFKNAPGIITKKEYAEKDLWQAKVQVFDLFYTKLLPHKATASAHVRKLIGLNDDIKRQFIGSILDITDKEIAEAVEYLDTKLASTVIISNRDLLERSNQKLEKPLELKQV